MCLSFVFLKKKRKKKDLGFQMKNEANCDMIWDGFLSLACKEVIEWRLRVKGSLYFQCCDIYLGVIDYFDSFISTLKF